MRYLGSKESLVEAIRQLLIERNLLDKELVFFDAFCGMGAVSNGLKQFYSHVVVNDSLRCATVFTLGRLYASSCSFDNLGFNPFDFFNGSTKIIKGFFYNHYSNGASQRMYFTAENAGRIDFFRTQIEEWKTLGKITEREYIYLLACLLESISKVSNTAGVYGAFLKHWDKRALKQIVFTQIEATESVVENISYYNDKIENIISQVKCDILYLDPPYTQNQYGTQYHILETLVLYDSPTISEVTGSRPTSPMRSLWSKMYHAQILFDKIIAETSAQYIILSYNNDGFMSKDFIEKTLKRYGVEDSYCQISIDYKKYNNTKCQGAAGHQEFLFFIEKKPKDQIVIQSPLNYTGSKAKMVNFIKQNMPQQDIPIFIDAFGGGFNVGINITADRIIYNDINPFVVDLIKSFRGDSYEYLTYIFKLIKKYNLTPDNKESYIKLRTDYNKTPIGKRDARMLYTLILYGFQQQIRFNSDYNFNNPSGSRWFNECLLSKFISFSRCSKQKNIVYLNTSFENLIDYVTVDSFVYADPPYRSTLGVYNDGKRGFEGWTIEHEKRLCSFLDYVNKKGAKFMLSYVLKVDGFFNLEIAHWVESKSYRIVEVNNTQGRYNNRNEVLIMNY